MKPVFTTSQVRRIEERAMASPAGPTLMERAGRATAEAARAMAPDTGGTLLVVAGPGNNGGDAWVAAAYLREGFHRAVVLDVTGEPPRAPEAQAAKARFLGAGGTVVREWPAGRAPGLVVDGLFGIGLVRDLQDDMAALVERVNASGAPVLAIDVPSGISSDTGRVRGRAVRAARTLTFIARKVGLHTGEALDHAGEVVLDDLGVDPALLEGARGMLLEAASLRGILAPRARNTHKGSFGTLGIVGGARGMTGAAILAARAALFAGAGKVCVGLLAAEGPLLDPGQPELMMRRAEDALAADVLVAGPGAGHSASGTSISAFERTTLPAILALRKPVLLDADALNAVAVHESLRKTLVDSRTSPTILTPHPAEAARLLRVSVEEVQSDRLAAALTLASLYRSEIVLKGAGSICASPDGTWAVNATGNPGLASGGTGDVLAGLVGALLCQGLGAREALRLGVCLHGAAADACVARGLGPIGLTASEVALEARALLNAASRA